MHVITFDRKMAPFRSALMREDAEIPSMQDGAKPFLNKKLRPAGPSTSRSDNYRKPIGFLIIGLCPQVAVPKRPQVAVVCAPKWPWISV
jgi:hypothetical protein